MTDSAQRSALVEEMSDLAADLGWRPASDSSWIVGGWRVGVAPSGPPRYLAFRDGQLNEFFSSDDLLAFVRPERAAAPVIATPAIAPTAPARTTNGYEGPMSVAGRLIGVSAVIGAALGIATILFLLLTGFFDASQNLDDIGAAVFGGVLVIGVVAFGLLIGIVLAGIGGVTAARVSADATHARIAGALGGALGHLALVLTLGVVLALGFLIFQGGGSAEPRASASPDPDCVQIFGADSEVCRQQQEPPVGGEPAVPWENIVQALAGLVPAGLAGGGAATVMFRREAR